MLKRVLNVGGSSNIDRLVWYPATSQLDIYFVSRKGAVQVDFYRYSNVGPNEFTQLAAAESVGKEFHRLIRSDAVKFPFERITRPLPPRNSAGQFSRP